MNQKIRTPIRSPITTAGRYSMFLLSSVTRASDNLDVGESGPFARGISSVFHSLPHGRTQGECNRQNITPVKGSNLCLRRSRFALDSAHSEVVPHLACPNAGNQLTEGVTRAPEPRIPRNIPRCMTITHISQKYVQKMTILYGPSEPVRYRLTPFSKIQKILCRSCPPTPLSRLTISYLFR